YYVTITAVGPRYETDLEGKSRRKDLEGACYRAVRRLTTEHAAEIDRRFPKILRRVGGYNLDCFVVQAARLPGDGRAGAPPAPRFNLAHLLVGSEGTPAVTLETTLRLIELPKAKIVAVLHFPDLLDALAATPAILEHRPCAVEVLDRYILDSTKLNPEASRLREFLQGDPGAILI